MFGGKEQLSLSDQRMPEDADFLGLGKLRPERALVLPPCSQCLQGRRKGIFLNRMLKHRLRDRARALK